MHRLATRRLGVVLAMLVLALVPLAWGQATTGARAAQAPVPSGVAPLPLNAGACRPGVIRGCRRAHAQAQQAPAPLLSPSQVTFSGPQASQYSVKQIINLNPLVASPYPTGSAFDPTNNTVYVTGFGSANSSFAVFALNTQTGAVQAIKDPRICAPNSVAVDPGLNKVFVGEQSGFGGCGAITSNLVVVIDGATNTVQATIPISQAPLFPAKITVNPTTHLIYVANQTEVDPCEGATCGNVAVINGQTNTLGTTIASPSINGPLGISADPSTNQVYVGDNVFGNYHPNQVTTIDGASNQVQGVIPVGHSPGAIKVGQIPVISIPTVNFCALSPVFCHAQPFVAQGADYDGPGGSVQAFNRSGVTQTFPVNLLPCGFGMSNLAVGQQLYASTPGDDAVAVLNPTSGALNAVIRIGSGCGIYGPTEMSLVNSFFATSGLLYINLAFSGQVLVIGGAH